MSLNLIQKLIKSHLIQGAIEPGKEIAISIDQTLTQDATGTMAYLQFEAMDIPMVRTRLSVSYVDHNTLQTGFENADDHLFLQTIAAKHGIHFSRPGNGICHQVHLERFGVPGQTLLGSDSHTPTAGGLGMLAIGAGGLDVAVAMGGGPFYLTMPRVMGVNLTGKLPPWVSAKDIILEILKRLSVKGGVGMALEYTGPGTGTLSVPERATITNMGAELGATTSVFPSDQVTREFLASQGREENWVSLKADPGAVYDQEIEVDLSQLEPLVAQPHSPDLVSRVKDIGPIPVNQVAIGSCTNSSYSDLMRVAAILRGSVVHPRTSLVIAPGSRQVLSMLAQNGALADLIKAGARILEAACGPCIGMGQAPASGAVTVRTFNRNFEGRSGTLDAGVYLTGPEVAAVTAIKGVLSDPRELGAAPQVPRPLSFEVDTGMILPPASNPAQVEVRRGPNIKPLPLAQPPKELLEGEVLLKVGDNITTDHIMPAGAKILPLRSNIPAIAQYVFEAVDPTFPSRALAAQGGLVVAGYNYGQGSSREHAALAPMYLGLKAVIALSFARIHRANLINFGILPLVFCRAEDYGKTTQGDVLRIATLRNDLSRKGIITVENVSKGFFFETEHQLSTRQVDIILTGGLLNFTKGN